MGWRFRKSIRLLPGLKLNLSKSGVSLSVGRRGATVNFGSRGTRGTVGLPGTGLSWSSRLGGTGTRAAASRAALASAPTCPKPVSLWGKLGIWIFWIALCGLAVPKGEAYGIVALCASLALTALTVRWINKRRARANAGM